MSITQNGLPLPMGRKDDVRPASVSLVSVPFRDGFILATLVEGVVWVPLAPMCDALGLRTHGQLARLRSKPWATTQTICGVAADGRTREMVFLDLRSLPMWLATIEPSRVRIEARAALVAYQVEAADVLYRHFLAPPPSAPVVPVDDLAERVRRLEGQVAELQGGGRQRGARRAPRLPGPRLSEEDASRVRVYCAGRSVVASTDVLITALGLRRWGRGEQMAVAYELRALGYERRRRSDPPRPWHWCLPQRSLTLVAGGAR